MIYGIELKIKKAKDMLKREESKPDKKQRPWIIEKIKIGIRNNQKKIREIKKNKKGGKK